MWGDTSWRLSLVFWPEVAGRALLPALAMIALAEIRAIRALGFYAAAGLAAGASAALWGVYAQVGASQILGAFVTFAGPLALLVATGALAGLTYWAIAGRSAGRWMPRPDVAP